LFIAHSGTGVNDAISGSTFNVSESLGYITASISTLTTAAADSTASILTLTTAAADSTASILTLTTAAADSTASILTLTTAAADATASILTLTTAAADATASILSLTTTVEAITSFPYSGSDIVNGDVPQAVITGSLLVTSIQALNDSDELYTLYQGDITASGHVLAAGVTASNAHVTTDLYVGGNLTVLGSNTNISTANLHVEDRFILLGSGSGTPGGLDDGNGGTTPGTAVDTGIIFESGSHGVGVGLFYDVSANRISIGKNIDDSFMSNAGITTDVDGNGAVLTDGIIAGNVVTVRDLTTTLGINLTGTVGTAATEVQFGVGEMVVDSADEIWIYTG